MATLSVETVSLTSITPTYNSAASGGDEFANNGRTFVYIKNGSGSPIVATVDSQTNCNQGFDHDVTITIPAGSEEVCGPFAPSRFNDTSGNVQLTYDDVTSLTIAVLALDT